MLMSKVISLFDKCLSLRWYSRAMMLICGGMYPFAFAPFGLWPIAFLSLIILITALVRRSELSCFQIGYFWGLGAFLVGTSWVYVSIHEFGYVPLPGAILITLLFSALLALFKGGFGYLCGKMLNYSHISLLVFIVPLSWLLSEFAQSTLFSGFPWLILGYSQIDSPFASLATWFGVYGVSWFVAALCALIVLPMIQKVSKGYWVGGLSFVGVLLITILVKPTLVKPMESQVFSNEANHNISTLNVALVQPNVPQEKKWDSRYFSSIIDSLLDESEDLWDADLIVWPEGAIPAYAHQVDRLMQELNHKATQTETNLLVGIPEYSDEKELSFVALKSMGKHPQTYHKQVLVPFGEYVPLQQWLRGLIKFLDLPMSNFVPALSPQSPMEFDKVTVIPAICYEIVYPDIIRDLSIHSDSNKPMVIVTVSNDAWFGDSFGPYQHMQMARMRSLELGIPLVRSTNDGITAVVDARGKMLKQIPRYQQRSLKYALKVENIDTYYRRWGIWGVLSILSISLLFIVWSVFIQRRQP